MALIACSECGTQISNKAAACVKCGAPIEAAAGAPGTQPPAAPAAPTAKSAQAPSKRQPKQLTWKQTLGGLAVGIGAIWFMASSSDDTPKPAEAPRQTEAQCRADLQCWASRHLGSAGVYCQKPIERLALHSVKWTDEGMFDTKFSRFKWLDQKAGTVTYFGDKAEFQNGFGAYTPMTYACDVGDLDKETPKVLDARIISEGRLP